MKKNQKKYVNSNVSWKSRTEPDLLDRRQKPRLQDAHGDTSEDKGRSKQTESDSSAPADPALANWPK